MTNTILNSAALKLGSLATSGDNTQLNSLLTGWHLLASTGSKVGINADSVRSEYSGAGISVGIFDDGIYTNGAAAGYGKHGTAVAGIVTGNGTVAGLASGASVTDERIIGLSNAQIAARMETQANYDIANHSWGWSTPFMIDAGNATYSALLGTITTAAAYGRDGLGTLVNIAAGNFKSTGFDTNASNFTNDRHAITVTAVTSEGKLTDYASSGASVLIAAPSNGGASGGILTADLPGAAGYSAGDVTNAFGGTSAATPQVSGVEALMLDANANLGWRDVKTILAMSAQTLSVGNPVENGAGTWNGGGLRFSNDTGFGLLDAHAAVRLAETWLATSTSHNEVSTSGTMSTQTRILDQTVTEFKIKLGSGVDVESASLSFDGYHGRSSDVTIQLVSPNGTVSTLLSGANGDKVLNDWNFTSNAFLGEESGGEWTVRVIDSKAGQQGVVNNLKLTVHGAQHSEDDTFVFTDSFSTLGHSQVVLKDGAGFDTINAAAVTSDSHIDLRADHVSMIDGRAVKIAAGTEIENAFGGDGNDTIIGNELANLIWGGRGNDIIYAGGGNDMIIAGPGNNVIDGGAGIDTLRLSGARSEWNASVSTKGVVASAHDGSQTDTGVSIERLMFDDGMLAFDFDGEAGQGFRIYQATFDRAPDLQGLSFWIRQLDKGMDLHEVADRFMDSNEFRGMYGKAASDSDFVVALYENVHHRAPDQEGQDFWIDSLVSGKFDRADVLVRFSESAENIHNVAGQIKDGIVITNEYLAF